MKLRDAIIQATKQDMPKDNTAETIINRYKAEEKRTFRKRKPGAVLAAAMIAVLAGSVSAIFVIRGGFEFAFDTPVDTGNIQIISQNSTNDDVEIELTQVWFDEYSLHIGGTVTTPEPLDKENTRYQLLCDYTVNGGEELMTWVRVYPTGERVSAFVLSAWQTRDENGEWVRHGVEGDTAELTLSFREFSDYSLLEETEGPVHYSEMILYPGTWDFTCTAVSTGHDTLTGSASCDTLTVSSAVLNPFTLLIEGVPDSEGNIWWLKMRDGTYIGKGTGKSANTDNRFEYGSESADSVLFTFEKPVDLTQAESVVCVRDWYTINDREGNQTDELWTVVLEIPLS